ncbi:hypothetical protein FGO68_gene6298 [Halteria grandinella]|uniref:Arginase n=1 Tax=Halteria grandinella TaxID=5974 RepID=A0A8J8NFX5_HALGN|nr:hypothetical protein FGO68_gene6298 [Halteria grandinella]
MEPEIPDNTTDQSEYIGSLIHEGFYDKLVLIGFPYDQGATLCGSKRGQDYGPDSFRRFVKDLGSIRNPEYGIDISKGLPSIADYGNIQIEGKPTQKQLMDKLTTKVNACIKRGNLAFVVGGTRDMTTAVVDGESKEKRKLVIMIRKSLDLKAVEQGEMHQRNSLRAILEQESFKSGHNKAIVVGMNLVSESEIVTFKALAPSSEFHQIEDVRRFKQHNQEGKLTLQGSDFINDLIAANPEYDNVYISISLEAVEGITDVSIPCVQGFTTEEIVEVCYQAGLNQPKLVSIDVADYNPFIEDWSTGRFLVLMFYYFALGLSTRIIQHQQ